MEKRFPINLQLFAEPARGTGETGTGTKAPASGEGGQTSPASAQNQLPIIDYAKIQQMLDGTLQAKEETALKSYFKQQGLSQQEAEQAMAAFKQQKAASQPDVGAMQTQLVKSQAETRQARLQAAATMAAVSLGINAKTIPYVLKMADFSQAIGQDGKINEETLKNALNKVLEDVPALKPQAAGSTGFVQVGASGSGGQQQSASNDALKKAFGL